MLWQTTKQYVSVEHHEPDGTLDVTFGALRVQVRDDVHRAQRGLQVLPRNRTTA